MKKIVNERKIKHWQGYGSVDAKLLKKTPNEMVVQVSGMHEYGLDCGVWNHDRVYEWLVKRFDPTKTERDIESVDIDDDYERRGNVDIEICTYTIHFGRGGMWQESADATLKDIERTYGPKVAKALVKYCELKKLDIEQVVSDTKEDGNGMTLWDKFDVWASKVQKLDIMGNFDDTIDWTGAEDEQKREKEFAKAEKLAAKGKSKGKRGMKKGRFGDVYSAPTDFSTIDESKVNESVEKDAAFVANWIQEELSDCEWVKRMGITKYEMGGESKFVIRTDEDKLLEVTVNELA